jgi:hypothetical protein
MAPKGHKGTLRALRALIADTRETVVVRMPHALPSIQPQHFVSFQCTVSVRIIDPRRPSCVLLHGCRQFIAVRFPRSRGENG